VFVSDGQVARPVGVAAVLLFATATWIPIASWVLLLGIQHSVPLVRIAVTWVVIAGAIRWGDNHDVRLLAGRPPALASVSTAFRRWLDERPDRVAFNGRAIS